MKFYLAQETRADGTEVKGIYAFPSMFRSILFDGMYSFRSAVYTWGWNMFRTGEKESRANDSEWHFRVITLSEDDFRIIRVLGLHNLTLDGLMESPVWFFRLEESSGGDGQTEQVFEFAIPTMTRLFVGSLLSAGQEVSIVTGGKIQLASYGEQLEWVEAGPAAARSLSGVQSAQQAQELVVRAVAARQPVRIISKGGKSLCLTPS